MATVGLTQSNLQIWVGIMMIFYLIDQIQAQLGKLWLFFKELLLADQSTLCYPAYVV